MSAKQLLFYVTAALMLDHETRAQSSQIGDFVGQLTSLLNQGGGLASALGALQGLQGGQGGTPGVYAPQQGGYFQQGPGPGVLGGPGYGFPPRPPPPGGLPPGGGSPFGGIPPPGGYPQGGGVPGGYPQGGGVPGGYPQPPAYPGALGGYAPTSLYGALASIAQYDDLRCVPRLLCEVAAGARPGSNNYNNYGSQSQQAGPFPFLTKDAVVTLLTVLNFVDDSPLLVFGRAAVLGYTARGDPRACLVAYPTCPRDPDKLVDYLNNHNGGFFRFFSNQQIPQYAPHYQYYLNPQAPHPQRPPYYPQQSLPPQPAPHYPPPPPQPLPPPNYYRPQRPYRPPPPPPTQHNYNQRPYSQQGYYQGRIQNLPQGSSGYDNQDSSGGTTKLVFANGGPIEPDYYGTNNYYDQSNQSFNQQANDYNKYDDYHNKQSLNKQHSDRKKVIFPVTSSYGSSGYDQSSASTSSQHSYHDVSGEKYTRNGKTLTFPSKGNEVVKGGAHMIFPDRTGTGDLRLDVDEFGGYKTVHYASEDYRDGIFRDQRDAFKNVLKFPVEEHSTGSGDNTMTFPRTR
ncbi:uncharacterized protein LOC111048365 [Nilaparvata lugens]|uniref:uncharacterized protein LOC111048365 n=1 Tax=Nilaparvata lugens TaxID=108931 RepID=UPI00193E4FD3|nr:uncharacterized protein LOC111048365 [Nilaparvata lugens]XP_039288322.1 uncharacterized protein LOC111048365 [Nilaparvata lugens]